MDDNKPVRVPDLGVFNRHYDDIIRLAGCGMEPREIALALELSGNEFRMFVLMAREPGSAVAHTIEVGRVMGVSAPMLKAYGAASAGNLDAVRLLSKFQSENITRKLIMMMDDDEYTEPTLSD